MRKRILFLGLCICWVMIISAQKRQRNLPLGGIPFVRFNLMGLIDLMEPNFSLGYEYPLNDNWSVSADAAWVFYSKYFAQTKHANGFIFRPAIRRYIGYHKNGYVETELHYKYVASTIEDWLGRDCTGDVPAYEEFMRFNYTRQVLGFHVKIGGQARLSRDDKLRIEYYFGLGPRWTFRKINVPNACYMDNGPFSEARRGENIRIAVPCGFRLLYNLKK